MIAEPVIGVPSPEEECAPSGLPSGEARGTRGLVVRPKRRVTRSTAKSKRPATTAAAPSTYQEALALAVALACKEIRTLPEAEPLRSEDELSTVDDALVLEHVMQSMSDLLACAANLTQRQLTADQRKPFREHVRVTFMRRFGLNPDSERHARAALLGLIDVAVKDVQREAWATASRSREDAPDAGARADDQAEIAAISATSLRGCAPRTRRTSRPTLRGSAPRRSMRSSSP